MELSEGIIRRDRGPQLIRQDSKPLTFINRIKCRNDDIDSLEEVINIERDMERYQKKSLRSLRPHQLYQMGMFESRSGLYRISREIEPSVLTQPVELRIVSQNIENELKYSGYKYIH